MISYTCPNDLEQFGFDCLTGEACGLGLRLLYDVNEMGHAVVARVLGLDVSKLSLPESWNTKFTAGSVMLTNEMAETCALFGMLYYIKPNCIEVWRVTDPDAGNAFVGLWGFDDAEELRAYTQFANDHSVAREHGQLPRVPGVPGPVVIRRFKNSTMPGTGDRNTHQMSGRTS